MFEPIYHRVSDYMYLKVKIDCGFDNDSEKVT